MRRHSRLIHLASAIAVAAILAVPKGVGAAPAGPVTTTTGSIAAVSNSTVTIASADGSRKAVKIQSDTLILRRETAALGSIKPDDALAVTAKKGAEGSLTAVSINIFSPQLWSRVRKGQWTMDSGDIMTNAQVTQVVERVDGRTLYMKLDQGTGMITVPNGAEIHRLTTVGLGDLKPGLRVTVRGVADSDGSIKATSITFDQPG